MSAVQIIREAAADGVSLEATEADTIRERGERSAVLRWLPVLGAHKQSVLFVLRGHGVLDTELDRHAELQMSAWEQTEALLQRLSGLEWLARYAPDRLPLGLRQQDFPVALLKPGTEFYVEFMRRLGVNLDHHEKAR